MNRPLKLLLTLAVVVAAPIPAAAQAWPATVVAAGARMAVPTAQPPTRIDRDLRLARRQTTVPPMRPSVRLKLNPVEVDDIPEVEIEPKDEWLDDQGLRLSPTRIAFKRRF